MMNWEGKLVQEITNSILEKLEKIKSEEADRVVQLLTKSNL